VTSQGWPSAGDPQPPTPTHANGYDRLLGLAELFESSGQELRARARLGAEVLADEAVAESAPLSPATFEAVADDLTAAMTGKWGLSPRALELDADAIVVRATVVTYRWIGELQEVAARTVGARAARAIGYLAPEVELGGAIIAAGLIETDAPDREAMSDYLGELAAADPDLHDHLRGGGLVESLQLRSLLTSPALAESRSRALATVGLDAIGVAPLAAASTAAVRDVAGPVVERDQDPPQAEATDLRPEVASTQEGSPSPPRSLEQLMTRLAGLSSVTVEQVGEHRYVAYLPGHASRSRRLRLVGGDPTAYARRAGTLIVAALAEDRDAEVLLVGAGRGGVAAAALASSPALGFRVHHVITAGAPAAQVPRLPSGLRMLSLEDRTDPVALLGSLVSASAPDRLVVVFDGAAEATGWDTYLAGGRAADLSEDPALREEIDRLRAHGFLAG